MLLLKSYVNSDFSTEYEKTHVTCPEICKHHFRLQSIIFLNTHDIGMNISFFEDFAIFDTKHP